MIPSSISQTVDALCASLGIVEWHYEPCVSGFGPILCAVFSCNVCKRRWKHREHASGVGAREAVIAALYEQRDGHVCDLALGPAGAQALAREAG